jgi:hypothetical protein
MFVLFAQISVMNVQENVANMKMNIVNNVQLPAETAQTNASRWPLPEKIIASFGIKIRFIYLFADKQNSLPINLFSGPFYFFFYRFSLR